MLSAAPGKSRGRVWTERGLALLFCLALTETLLRGGFMLALRFGPPPNCGLRPELLGRLVYAYSHDRPSPTAADQGGLVPDQHRGYRLAPNMRQREVHGAAISSNSGGIRGEREYASPKPSSVLRLIALGDSFTFGEGVPDSATWPTQLEQALSNVEVVNLGMPAYAHDQMYFALVDDGMPLEPDAVILGFYPHDKWRDELTFYCSDKPRFSPTPDGWRIENIPVPLPWDAHDQYKRLPFLYALPRILIEALTQSPLDDHSGEERATEILHRMRKRTEAAGARFIIVNLPDHPEGPAAPQDFFKEYCSSTGAECVDTWPLFRAMAGTEDVDTLRARYLRPNDIHYSRDGYAVVAEALRRHLAQHPIKPALPRANRAAVGDETLP